ncbi:toprim domain-containing protein [Tumebacillus sp. ITR2]|uniref:Toprim domain-containing protein n=1 Tax=Tumebacillus amylolyticus TaxID=2801339 RepID=A0ABS1JBV4_9BACL|nr:DnaB-like helicase C-terminal domain-containing protein [Tumebacillus amylolyticus]MBL0387756.1 toprim domain-containing protein [Tumebacillus amylolyticus]
MTMFQPAIGTDDLEELVSKYQKQLDTEALLYLESRDISEKTIANFSLGYEDIIIGFSVAENSGLLPGRIVFPIRDMEGRIRDLIGRTIDDREPKYKALLGDSMVLFNEPVLADNSEIVIAGGMFDVLSLHQVPIPAVAVPDCYSFHKDQAQLFADKRVFICFGNDEEGRREAERVFNLLEAVAEEVFIVTLPEGIKDINDLYVRAENAKEVFVSLINRAIQTKQESGMPPDEHYLTTYNEEFLKRQRGQTTGIPSGVAELDDLLLGGFRPGLYVLSGPIGSGKTTLLRQMADHAAFLDCPVAYFSWQNSSFELWANSIGRLLNVSWRDILLGNANPEMVKQANEHYNEFADHIWTLEASVDNSVEDIADFVQRIAQTNGREPVVFLDYLQRIPHSKQEMLPSQERASMVAYELHMLARDLNCPVIVAANADREDRDGELLAQALEATVDVWMHLSAYDAVDDTHELQVVQNRNGDRGSIRVALGQDAAIFRSTVE